MKGCNRGSVTSVLIKALVAFLILPGFFAGILPWLLSLVDPWRGNSFGFGIAVMVCGFFIVLWCVRDFYISGKGTLAPWSPPKHLVVIGLYRFCRNPMYVGILILVGGWAFYSASPLLGCYLAILATGFHNRVTKYEEPKLAKLFGPDWESYSKKVSRWLPRL